MSAALSTSGRITAKSSSIVTILREEQKRRKEMEKRRQELEKRKQQLFEADLFRYSRSYRLTVRTKALLRVLTSIFR